MFEVDRFNFKERTKREYAKIWSWSPGKVIRFIAEIGFSGNEDSLSFPIKADRTTAEQTRNSDGTAKELKNSMLRDAIEQCRNSDGTETEHVFIKREKREDTFVQFWNLYPKKKSKAAAMKSWLKLNPCPELLTVILKAVAWQAQQSDWKKNGGQFVPNPSTWINNRRWEDEGGSTTTRSDNRYGMFAGAY